MLSLAASQIRKHQCAPGARNRRGYSASCRIDRTRRDEARIHSNGLVSIGFREKIFQGTDFGQIVFDDIGVIGILEKEILVDILGRIEPFEGIDSRDDRLLEDVSAL